MLLGATPSLALFTALGYIAFTSGAALLWKNRGDIGEYLRVEFGALRAELFRRDMPTRWSSLRESDCLSFGVPRRAGLHSDVEPSCLPPHRLQITYGAGLVFVGQVLFLLAFMS